MRRRLSLIVLFVLATAWPTYAQLSLPYTTFTTGQVISSAQFTTDMTQISANALNRTGGTLTGTLLFSPDNQLDIGANGATRPRDLWLGRNLTVGGTATLAATTLTGGLTADTLTLNGTAPQLSLANATSNWIQWNGNGAAPPAFTTRSVGTKLVLNPAITASTADYALGIDTNTLWFSVPNTGTAFNWYAGTTSWMTLNSSGLTLTSAVAAPQITFANATSNWIQWPTNGIAPPALTTRSAGTRLVLYPNETASTTDFALGIDTNTLWFSVPTTAQTFNWYAATTSWMQLTNPSSLLSVNLSPGADSLGARIQIAPVSSANAPAVFQAGEPGVSVSNVIIANNYHATTTGASGQINTGVGGSYIQLSTSGTIVFNRLSSGGTISASASWDANGTLTQPGALLLTGEQALTTALGNNGNIALNAGTAVLRVTLANGGASNITGFTGGADGRHLWVCVVTPGTGSYVFVNSDASSSAANQIISQNLPSASSAQTCYGFRYDGGLTKWMWIQ